MPSDATSVTTKVEHPAAESLPTASSSRLLSHPSPGGEAGSPDVNGDTDPVTVFCDDPLAPLGFSRAAVLMLTRAHPVASALPSVCRPDAARQLNLQRHRGCDLGDGVGVGPSSERRVEIHQVIHSAPPRSHRWAAARDLRSAFRCRRFHGTVDGPTALNINSGKKSRLFTAAMLARNGSDTHVPPTGPGHNAPLVEGTVPRCADPPRPQIAGRGRAP